MTGQITHISSANGYATLTVSGKTIFIYQSGINAGNVAFRTPKSYGNTHGLFKTVEPNTGTRIHFEPNGYVGSGTVVKVDYMFDDYDTDTMNYRISAILNYVGDPNKTGEGAVTVLNSKSTGHGWGNWPSFHFGFQDDKYCPMKVMLYDSAANQIFAPMMGMWHESKPITLDDYVTANNKIYRAKNTGVTGSAPPSHASGIASDGNIDWEFIRAPRGVDISATVLIGNINSTPLPNLVGHAMQVQEPIAVGRNGRFDFVDEEGKLVGRIISSLGGNGERLLDIISNDGGSRLRLNSTNKTLQLVNLASTSTAKTQNATTQPNISATGIVRVGNVNAYTINKFLGGTAGQEFILESTTANLTTLKHNSAIRLVGETDLVLKDKQALKFLVAADGETVIQI
ncbi:hypothetical protein A3Q29_11340 [Providencia stuartii]|uniref:Uncharacterized protein n=1 Tax=Providencia stuartii TaxID=588 RepID=A0A1S1HJB7_PROST|nr:hypothetical protein A3Q29_11340 [Providencia stuartii]